MKPKSCLAPVILLLLVPCACTPESLEFADWTISVPEGTPIIEYAAVPTEERTERIELVEDLVIAGDLDDTNYLFYRPNEIAVDSAGRIFVLDYGNNRIQAFDSGGQYFATMGQEGEGPGEFLSPTAMTIAGDRLLVNDFPNSRISVWSLKGEYVESIRPDPPLESGQLLGFPDGTLVSLHRDWSHGRRPPGVYVAEKLATNGGQAVRYAEVLGTGMFLANRAVQGAAVPIVIPMRGLDIAAHSSGALYVAACAEYQVHAFTLDGSLLWALRVPWERQPIPEKLFNSKVEEWRERMPEFTRADWDDPGDYSALWAIRVDGHGHLYVFPDARTPSGEQAVERPVDIYSAEGEHIFSGMISDVWDAAHGDFVYKLRLNEETDEHELVRYRLVEPF